MPATSTSSRNPNTSKNSIKNTPASMNGPSGSSPGVASKIGITETSRRYGTVAVPGLKFPTEAGPSRVVVVVVSPDGKVATDSGPLVTHKDMSQNSSGGTENAAGPRGNVPRVHNPVGPDSTSSPPYNQLGLLPTAINMLKGNPKNHQLKSHQNKATYTRRLSPHPNSAALNCRLEGALCADFTLDGSGAAQQRKQSIAQARHRKCCCWLMVFLALGVFIAVMVAVSWYITGGKRVFGPM